MSGPILVGYDGTEGARAALAEAKRLSGPLGAEVVCVFVRHVGALGGEAHDLADAVTERANTVLAEAGPEVRTAVVDGRPADALNALAAQEGAQMIVIGSYGERPLRGVLVGSTPYRILHGATVPVLVVAAHA